MTQVTTQDEQVREEDSGFIRRSISLYPEQDATVSQFAKDSGLESYSSALRFIINEWRRLKLAELNSRQ